jgi:hypothetical protein
MGKNHPGVQRDDGLIGTSYEFHDISVPGYLPSMSSYHLHWRESFNSGANPILPGP